MTVDEMNSVSISIPTEYTDEAGYVRVGYTVKSVGSILRNKIFQEIEYLKMFVEDCFISQLFGFPAAGKVEADEEDWIKVFNHLQDMGITFHSIPEETDNDLYE